MSSVEIIISDKLKSFLDRYFSLEKTLAERFYDALAEGHIIHVGKGFCLTIEAREKLDKIILHELDLAESDRIQQMHQII